MNDDRAFERATRDWLESGSDRTSAATIDAVLLAIRTTPQERDLRIPWRSRNMSNLPRLAGIAAVVVLAVVAVNLFGRGLGPAANGTPSPEASRTPEPSATSLASPTTLASTAAPSAAALPGSKFSGALAAGTYHSTRFSPAVVITVPDGWRLEVEDSEVLVIKRDNLELAFTHNAATVSAAGANDLAAGTPTSVTLGLYQGFKSGPADGMRFIFLTETGSGPRPVAGSLTWGWVVDVHGRALSIQLNGPGDEATAALPEVEAILATLGAAS
jgi:hypothetical protein